MIEPSELHAILEETTQSLPGTIDEDTDLGGLDGWDSMGIVIFIDAIQARAGIELAVHDLRACSRSPEILALIRRAP